MRYNSLKLKSISPFYNAPVCLSSLLFDVVGDDVGHIDEVVLRRARVPLGWVTESWFNSWCGTFISL